MSFLSKKKNVLQYYKYLASGHLIFCRGPVDKVLAIHANEQVAWQGNSLDGNISISTGGGDEAVRGTAELMLGSQTQTQNSFLAGIFGALTPAYRRRLSLVLKRISVGKSPVWPSFFLEAQRVHVKDDGAEQWYDEKAEIRTPIQEYVGGTLTVLWEQSSYHPTNDDDAGMGLGFYDITGTLISNSFSTIIGTAHSVWTARSWSATIPEGTASIRVYMRMHRDEGTANDGYIRNITLKVKKDGFTKTCEPLNPSGNSGTAHWTVEYGGLGVKSTPPNCYFYGGNSVNSSAWQKVTGIGLADMNPVHIIRECLCSNDFGASVLDAEIDDANFMAAADQLYDEGFGLSFVWDTSSNILEFIELVRSHINAEIFVHPETGKWNIRLIRDDYDIGTLPEFNRSNVVAVSGFKARQFTQLTNSVTVNYINPFNYETASVTTSDPALVLMQGQVNSSVVTMEGISSSVLATRVARRELGAASRPLVSCTMIANSDASTLLLGDVIKLTWPDLQLDGVLMRVTEVKYGSSTSNRVQVNLVQDMFALPELNYTISTQGPAQSPQLLPCPEQLIIEAPYIEAVASFGQGAVDSVLADDPTAGFVLVAGSQPNSATDMNLHTDDGSGYQYIASGAFTVVATLTAALDKQTTTFAIEDDTGIENVTAGTWLMMGSERMTYVSYSAPNITVKRGLLDTVPVEHSLGEILFFLDETNISDDAPYDAGDAISAKLLTKMESDVLDIADATALNHTFEGIMVKPYPPGQVKINSTYWPATVSGAFTVTWVHRNRLTQIDENYLGFVDAGVTAADNTRYGLRFLNALDVLLVEKTNIGPGTASVTLNYTGNVTMELWTIDDNGASWQVHRHVFAYTPPGGGPTNSITATAYTPVFNGTIIDGGGA